jgi:hypothetical protein
MGYVGKSSDGFGIRERYRFSASGSQTAFTGSDLNGKTLLIDNGSLVDVYLNGVLLDTADYNTNTANQITLTSGATASDEVMIIVYDVFALSDAMPKSGGAFTGNVTGAGMDLLLSATISSAVSAYDIDSTYINSTYDSYFLTGQFIPATDNVGLYIRVFVGGSVQTGSIYGREVASLSASNYASSNASTLLALPHYWNIGGDTDEGITINGTLQNVNNTARACCISGFSNAFTTTGNHVSAVYSGSLIKDNTANVVNGLRFVMSSGNIASGSVKLYGLKD